MGGSSASIEIISENFVNLGGLPREHLENLRRDYSVAAHGVGLSIVSYDPLNQQYLKDDSLAQTRHCF